MPDFQERWEHWIASNPLYRWRAAHNHISRSTVASQLGVGPNTPERWERGQSHPSPALMEKLKGLTGIGFKEWTDWLEQRPEQQESA